MAVNSIDRRRQKGRESVYLCVCVFAYRAVWKITSEEPVRLWFYELITARLLSCELFTCFTSSKVGRDGESKDMEEERDGGREG